LSKVIIYSFMQCEGIGMYFEPSLHTNRKNSCSQKQNQAAFSFTS
jgi:hypothetical protein